MPVAEWGREDVEDLLAYVERVGEEELDPADYQPERLRAALAGADEIELGRAATDVFLRLSSDLSLGHARGDARLGWHIKDDEINGNPQYALMATAPRDNTVRDTLSSLLPPHPPKPELLTVQIGKAPRRGK